jgi:hypothetical protein
MPNNPSSKRRRTEEGIHVEYELSSTNSRNCLHKLPLEMFAEILSYTSSPDILSLARASRFLCATLVTNQASLFIWKAARRRFQPKPIPDPAPNWTESAYIAFIFDTALCEVRFRHVFKCGGTKATWRCVTGRLSEPPFLMRCGLVFATP